MSALFADRFFLPFSGFPGKNGLNSQQVIYLKEKEIIHI